MTSSQHKRNIVGSGMICCFASREFWHPDVVLLDTSEIHHITRVLRMKNGGRIRVLDGWGRCADGRLEIRSKTDVCVHIDEVRNQPPIKPQIILMQSLIKNSHMDWLVQKAVELGVSDIVPVQADRSVVKVKSAALGERKSRLLAVAKSAQKQCSILWLPEIHVPQRLNDALKGLPGSTLVLYGALEVESRPLRDFLRTIDIENTSHIAVVVGPEGDFSPEEYDMLHLYGAVPVSLGNNILRSETAALHMISALRYEFATV
jgi:16S rRNA (uracil1498-N3)-methyltransferase